MIEGGGDTGEESFPQLVSRVVDDAKELARAEVALARVQVAANIARYRTAVLLFVAAAAIAIATLIVGGMGAVIALAPLLGAVWATLTVCVFMALTALLCVRFGISRFKRKWIAPVPQELE